MAHVNNGVKNEPEICQWPEGFTPLSDEDPLVKNRDTRETCILFALSGTPSWKLPPLYSDRPKDQRLGMPNSYYFDHLHKHLRAVDLDTERAMPGDIVVYYNSFTRSDFAIRHMAVVTETDENGMPIKVIAKMAYGDVVEHRVDQASLAYGYLWVVMRDKTIDL